MSHPDRGQIRAFLDSETDPKEASRIRSHLETCGACRAMRDELRSADETIHAALATLTSDPDLDAARERVRGRVASPERRGDDEGPSTTPDSPRSVRSPDRARPWWRRPGALVRAAVLVLALAGGAAAAIPGSPLRQWLGDLWDPGPDGAAPPPATAPAAPEQASDSPGETEIRTEPVDGRIRVDLVAIEAGTPVRVVLVDRASAGVAAGTAARFRSGPGRVAVSGARSEVRVEIPRTVTDARVTANGILLFRKEGQGVTVPSPTPDTAGTELLLRAPPEGDGSR